MAKVKGYGCSSVIHALCLQFSLAGLGLRCKIQRTSSGQWVVGAELRDYTRSVPKDKQKVSEELIRTVTPPVGLCDCNQGRLPCSGCAKAQASSITIHGGV